MDFFIIASNTMKRLVRNTKTMIMKILLPIGLIAILGSVFSANFEAVKLDKCKVAFVNLDSGKYAEETIKALSEEESFKELISFEIVESFQEAENKYTKKEVDAAVVFPEDFSKNYESLDGRITLSVYTNKYASNSEVIVKNVMESYANVVNIIRSLNTIGKSDSISDMNFSGGARSVKAASLSADGKAASAMQYYAVTMLIFTLFNGTVYGIDCIAEDYLGILGKRMRSTPAGLVSQYGGKILGCCLVNFIQGIVLMIFASACFGVTWGDRLFTILFAAFSFSVFATTVGAMLCMFLRNQLKAAGLCSVLVPVFTFISGGFTKADSGLLTSLSPNHVAQTAIFNAMFEVDSFESWKYICILWIGILLFGFLTVLAGRREQ